MGKGVVRGLQSTRLILVWLNLQKFNLRKKVNRQKKKKEEKKMKWCRQTEICDKNVAEEFISAASTDEL
jgi:hypothetical protein